MNFSELRQNYPVYILNKTDMTTIQGKVVNVNAPYFQQPNPMQVPMPMPMQQQPTQRVVDVTIDMQGKTQTFTITETSAITCAQIGGKDFILSTDKQGIIREVEVIKSQSEEALSNVDRHKAVINSCDTILSEWNPEFAEKKQQDERISGLEKQVEKMGKMLSDFINEFKK